MRKFQLKADAIFEANDIDDAMRLLAAHFRQDENAEYADNESVLILSGEINVAPYHTKEGTEQ